MKLTAEDIIRLAHERKCVSIPKCRIDRMTAAFMMSMQFSVVMRFISAGCYEYIPKKKQLAQWPKKPLLKSDF